MNSYKLSTFLFIIFHISLLFSIVVSAEVGDNQPLIDPSVQISVGHSQSVSSVNLVIPNSTVNFNLNQSKLDINLLCPVCFDILCLIRGLQTLYSCDLVNLCIQLNSRATALSDCNSIIANLNLDITVTLKEGPSQSNAEKCNCLSINQLITFIQTGCLGGCSLTTLVGLSDTYLQNQLCGKCICVLGLLTG